MTNRDPRPNQLSGQVQPNTLGTTGPRLAGRTPPPNVANELSGQAPGTSGWAATSPAATSPAPPTTSVPPRPAARPASIAAPPSSGWTSAQQTTPATPARTGSPRRTSRLSTIWTLIVLGFIAFNFLRGFLASGLPGSDNPTTAPVPSAQVVQPPADFTIDPKLTPGTVEFGEAAGTNCDVTNPGTSFALGTRVWWSATLGVELPSDTTVFWQVTRDGTKIGGDTVPGDSSGGSWNVLCGNEPISGATSGTYVLQVLDEAQRVVLSIGTYTVRGS
jgi:hypothetical protein